MMPFETDCAMYSKCGVSPRITHPIGTDGVVATRVGEQRDGRGEARTSPRPRRDRRSRRQRRALDRAPLEGECHLLVPARANDGDAGPALRTRATAGPCLSGRHAVALYPGALRRISAALTFIKNGRSPARRARPRTAPAWPGKGARCGEFVRRAAARHSGLAAGPAVPVPARAEPIFGSSELHPAVPGPVHHPAPSGTATGPACTAAAAGGALDLQLAELAVHLRARGVRACGPGRAGVHDLAGLQAPAPLQKRDVAPSPFTSANSPFSMAAAPHDLHPRRARRRTAATKEGQEGGAASAIEEAKKAAKIAEENAEKAAKIAAEDAKRNAKLAAAQAKIDEREAKIAAEEAKKAAKKPRRRPRNAGSSWRRR